MLRNRFALLAGLGGLCAPWAAVGAEPPPPARSLSLAALIASEHPGSSSTAPVAVAPNAAAPADPGHVSWTAEPLLAPPAAGTPSVANPLAAPPAPVIHGASGCCDQSCASPRFYGSVDALLWWFSAANLPPLVTSDNTLAGVPPGVLGGPGTGVLLGGSLGTREHAGTRLSLGGWLDEQQQWGVEGNILFLSQRSRTPEFASPGGDFGTATIFRPFLDATAGGLPNSQIIAGPAQPGALSVGLLQRMVGAEAILRRHLTDTGDWRVDLLAGFRFLGVDENLDIDAVSIGTGGTPTLASAESFATRNRFYGGQLGVEATYRRQAWSVKLLGKAAVGLVHEVVHINGNTIVSDPATGAVLTSGPTSLLAQSSNIGRYDRNQFCFVPELGVTLGYHVTENLALNLGYSWLYLSNATRAGDAIDLNTTIPTVGLPPGSPTQPAFTFRDSDFWAQGISLGLNLRY